MGDIGGEVRLTGKDILHPLQHVVKGQREPLQFDRHRLRVKSHVEIPRGNILDLPADLADRFMSLIDHKQHDGDDQQADYRRGGNQLRFQLINIVQVKIDG